MSASRRIVPLTLDNLNDLPAPCRSCTFWEMGPLADPDPDLSLDLQPLLDDVYSLGRYGERIDYSRPLDPPLTPEQVAWLEKRLQPEAPPEKPPAPRPRRPRRR